MEQEVLRTTKELDNADESIDLEQVIEQLCNSKAAEFGMLGYDQVSGQDIWECVSDKYQKTGNPPLHQIVNDILSLKSTRFMNWNTMRMYRGSF